MGKGEFEVGSREIQVLLERDFGRDSGMVEREKKMVLFNFDLFARGVV